MQHPLALNMESQDGHQREAALFNTLNFPGGYPLPQQQQPSGERKEEFLGFIKSQDFGGRGRGRGGSNKIKAYFSSDSNQVAHNKASHAMSLYQTNPVGALHERFTPRKITPEYTVEQQAGQSHCPVFSCSVQVQDLTAQGIGSTKKQAKHNAARAMLDKLDGKSPLSGDDQATMFPTQGDASFEKKSCNAAMKSSNGSGSEPSSTKSAPVPFNPIGKLQEYCMNKVLPAPLYTLEETKGDPHMRYFKMRVTVGSLFAIGEGSNKKEAKRDAAIKIFTAVEAKINNKEPTKLTQVGMKEELQKVPQEVREVMENFEKLSLMSDAESKQLKQFFSNVNGKGLNLRMLHETPISKIEKYHTVLEKLSQDLSFEFISVNLGEDTAEVADDRFSSTIQIKTSPLVVVYGTGKDQDEARQKAAKNALKYIKLMTIKSKQSADDSSTPASVKEEKTDS